MFKQMILLAGSIESAALAAVVRFHNPNLEIHAINSLEELQMFDKHLLADTRLIAFATETIVPRAILEALGYGAYNFHPGPPQYPGWAPSCFAIYEGADQFGVTAHIMSEKVDAGPIVGTELFCVAPQTPIVVLESMSLIRLARLFWDLSVKLATQSEPLASLPIAWSGRKSSRKLYRAMCELPLGATVQEVERRIAAFGRNVFGNELTVTLHGHQFRYVAPDNEATKEIPANEAFAQSA